MRHVNIADTEVAAIGLGCMNLSHAYGKAPSEQESIRLIHAAYERGVRHFDTAALYGFGANETLLGKALRPLRANIHLASKCGMTGVDGKRVIDNRPATLVATVDEALKRLQTDHIDVYYLHRWDKKTPIEESIEVLSRLVEQGKLGALGLSEVSASTLRKAHAVHPIAALQTEYSLWTRNPEIAVLKACQELGAVFVAFSPLGRGFLSAAIQNPAELEDSDIRRKMPRFNTANFSANQALLMQFCDLAKRAGCTPGQLALDWLLHQGAHIMVIPGTRSIAHLEENIQTAQLSIHDDIRREAGELINQSTVSGARYPDITQVEIDTEEFAQP